MIDLKQSQDKFKPGLPFSVTANVRYHDKNMPVTDKHNPLKFNVTYYYDVMRKCTRRKYSYYHRRLPIPEVTMVSVDDETTTLPETTTTAETTTEQLEEYDCREEKFYDKITEIFLKNGRAEIDLDMPDNTTRIGVLVSKNKLVIYEVRRRIT